MINNPFRSFGSPVSGELFVGRDEIVNEAVHTLRHLSSYSLFGLHRIGKSSIGRSVLAKLTAEGFCCGEVMVTSFSTEKALWEEILDSLNMETPEEWEAADDNKAFRVFRNALKIKAKSGAKSIVLLDELDGISKYKNSGQIINRIREVAYNPSLYNLAFLFISARTLDCIQGQSINNSSLAGICQTSPVPPLKKNDVARLVGLCPKVEDGVGDCVFKMTGGHPFLAAALLCRCIEEANGGIITAKTVDDVKYMVPHFPSYMSQLKSFFNSNWDGAWMSLGDVVVGPLLRRPTFEISDLLDSYGICYHDPAQLGFGDSSYFQDYLRAERRFSPAFSKIARVERLLRDIVANFFKTKFGDNWVEFLRGNDPWFANLYGELSQIMLKEQKGFGLGGPNDILEYSYTGTLKDIIVHFWANFQEQLGDSKRAFITWMDAICVIRNPVCHTRRGDLIPPEKQEMANRCCDEIFRLLDHS